MQEIIAFKIIQLKRVQLSNVEQDGKSLSTAYKHICNALRYRLKLTIFLTGIIMVYYIYYNDYALSNMIT